MEQSGKSNQNVTQIAEKLISAGKISKQDYHQLSKVILADNQIDEEERRQVNRIFDAIQSGKVRIVD